MTENEQTIEEEREEATTDDQPAAEPKNADTPDPVPYDRFRQINEERKEFKDQLAELKAWREEQEAEKKLREEEQMEEKEQFKELAEKRERELSKLEEKLEEKELQFQEWRNQRAISDAAHEAGVAPKLARRIFPYDRLAHDDDGNPINAGKLLEATIEEFGLNQEQKPDGVPASPRPEGDGKLTDEEKRKRAFFPRL